MAGQPLLPHFPPLGKVLRAIKSFLVLGSACFLAAASLQVLRTGEEQWGGEAPAHPICTRSPGPKSSLHFSVVLPLTTLTRRNDTFLRLVEPTFTDICCMDTQRCADTHPRYTLTNQPTQRNTHNTLALGDTFNNTNLPTDTHTQACEGARTHVRAHTPPTSA